MKGEDVIFKGTRDGLQIYIDDAVPFEQIKEGLCQRLRNAGDFFKGADMVVQFVGKTLDPGEINELKHIMEAEAQATISVKDPPSVSTPITFLETDDLIIEGPAKFVYNTIRSGQKITYDGNIIVIGDVNAGAEIVAGGNIVVIGSIRGVVHAGAGGNQKAVIVAGSMQALQLRISSIIARSPDDGPIGADQPEIAYISHSEIIIEPYLKASSIKR